MSFTEYVRYLLATFRAWVNYAAPGDGCPHCDVPLTRHPLTGACPVIDSSQEYL